MVAPTLSEPLAALPAWRYRRWKLRDAIWRTSRTRAQTGSDVVASWVVLCERAAQGLSVDATLVLEFVLVLALWPIVSNFRFDRQLPPGASAHFFDETLLWRNFFPMTMVSSDFESAAAFSRYWPLKTRIKILESMVLIFASFDVLIKGNFVGIIQGTIYKSFTKATCWGYGLENTGTVHIEKITAFKCSLWLNFRRLASELTRRDVIWRYGAFFHTFLGGAHHCRCTGTCI